MRVRKNSYIRRCVLIVLSLGFGVMATWAVNKTFTGPGNFSDATKWNGGSLPSAGDRLIIMNTCFVDAAMSELAYSDLQVGKGAPDNQSGTIFWPVGSTRILNVKNISGAGPGGTLDMTNGGTLKITGSWNSSGVSFIPGVGAIDIEVSPPPFNIPAAYPTYYNLTIRPGAGTNAIIETNITINKDLTIISGATLDTRDGASVYNITLRGNWSNSGAFEERTSTVIMDGTGNQTITAGGGGTFYNFTVNKSSGDVILSNDVTVSNLLALTSGDVILGANNLTIGTSGTTSGASTSSYVQADGAGIMKKLYSATGSFTFPVGDVDEYTPFTINLGSATLGASPFLSVRLTDAIHPNIDASGDYISRYWVVNSGDITAISYDVSYSYVDADVAGTEANLLTSRWDGTSWTAYDPVNAATNTLSSSTGITVVPSNNAFTGGNVIALPVELSEFHVNPTPAGVSVQWATTSENNNKYFDVQRSSDGRNFITIGQVTGASNSARTIRYYYTDREPLEGIAYYRLKQTGFNSHIKYSNALSVNYRADVNVDIKLYPNPAVSGQSFNLNYSNPATNGQEVLITVYDFTGRTVYSKVILQESDGALIAIDPANKLRPGVYFVTGSSSNEIFKQRLVIVDSNN